MDQSGGGRIRLPGTLLALVLKADVCWTDSSLVPTIQGQYLIKDSILLTAALAIGGSHMHHDAASEREDGGARRATDHST